MDKKLKTEIDDVEIMIGKVMQIGFRTADAAGGRHRLIEMSMDLIVFVDQRQQPFNIGAVQLGQGPVL